MASLIVNWKTTAAGIGLLALAVADALGKGPNGPGAAWAELMAAFAAFAAKDANVTGGTVSQ